MSTHDRKQRRRGESTTYPHDHHQHQACGTQLLDSGVTSGSTKHGPPSTRDSGRQLKAQPKKTLSLPSCCVRLSFLPSPSIYVVSAMRSSSPTSLLPLHPPKLMRKSFLQVLSASLTAALHYPLHPPFSASASCPLPACYRLARRRTHVSSLLYPYVLLLPVLSQPPHVERPHPKYRRAARSGRRAGTWDRVHSPPKRPDYPSGPGQGEGQPHSPPIHNPPLCAALPPPPGLAALTTMCRCVCLSPVAACPPPPTLPPSSPSVAPPNQVLWPFLLFLLPPLTSDTHPAASPRSQLSPPPRRWAQSTGLPVAGEVVGACLSSR